VRQRRLQFARRAQLRRGEGQRLAAGPRAGDRRSRALPRSTSTP
jgi:hypothetical protein